MCPPASEVGAAIFHYTAGIFKPAPVVSFKGSMFIANPATNVVICGRYAGASLVGGAGCKGRRPAEREGPSVRKGGLLHGVMCTSIPGHLAAALPDRADQIIYFPKPRDDGAKSGLNKCDMRPCGVHFCALSVLSQAWVVPLGAPALHALVPVRARVSACSPCPSLFTRHPFLCQTAVYCRSYRGACRARPQAARMIGGWERQPGQLVGQH